MTTTSNRSDHDASRDDDNNAHGYNDNSGRDSNTFCVVLSDLTADGICAMGAANDVAYANTDAIVAAEIVNITRRMTFSFN